MKINSLRPYALSLLRAVTGFLFALHGMQKVFGMFGGIGGHAVPFMTTFWIAGVLELIGGPLLISGLFTRPVAFLLSGEMAVAYFTAHAPRGGLPLQNNGEPAVLYCFLFLYLATAGAGPISIDRLRHKA